MIGQALVYGCLNGPEKGENCFVSNIVAVVRNLKTAFKRASPSLSGAHNRVRIRSGDKGYDADSYIESLQKRGIQVVMPPKAIAKSNVNVILRFITQITVRTRLC